MILWKQVVRMPIHKRLNLTDLTRVHAKKVIGHAALRSDLRSQKS
jgi:hypothetical protein